MPKLPSIEARVKCVAIPVLVLIASAVAVGAPAAARAATFCVNFANAAECSGTKAASVEAAISAASSTAGRDTIDIAGGHSYEEPAMNDTIGNPVDIIGIGATPPILSATTPGATTLTVENNTSTLTNLQLSINGAGSTGLLFDGAVAKRIHVAGLTAGNESIGVELRHGALRESTVEMAHSVTVGTTAVEAGEGTAIEGSTLAATWGAAVECCEAHVVVSRVETLGPVGIRADEGGHVAVEDSLLLVSGITQGKGTSAAIVAAGSPAGPGSMKVESVTAYDLGGSANAGVLASFDGNGETMSVRDSIVRGFDADLRTLGAGAVINADYDDYSSAEGPADGIKAGAHNLDLDPGFVDLAGGDLHLAPGSPLIDRGDPAGSTAGVDFYGDPRLVAGLGGLPLLDIGAAEFQPGVDAIPPLEGPGPPPGGDTPGGGATPRAAAPALVLSTARRRLGPDGTFTYRLGCPAGLVGPCEGAVRLRTSGKVEVGPAQGGKAPRRVLPIGVKRFTIASGSAQQLTIKPDRRSRLLLSRLRMLRLTATATASVADSPNGVSTAKFELLAPTR